MAFRGSQQYIEALLQKYRVFGRPSPTRFASPVVIFVIMKYEYTKTGSRFLLIVNQEHDHIAEEEKWDTSTPGTIEDDPNKGVNTQFGGCRKLLQIHHGT